MIKRLLLSSLLFIGFNAQAQDDLLSMFDEEETTDYATASFKATRVVLGQSVENPKNGNLNFLIQHQFGSMKDGAYEMWGFDQAIIRLGFEYGITDWLGVGFGRSSFNKSLDFYGKVKMLRQSKGKRKMPITLSYFGGAYYNSTRWQEPEKTNYETSRYNFCHQLLIARKFNDRLTLQISPGVVHRNLVATKEEEHDVFSLPVSGRFKLTNRLSLNAEYYYLLPGFTKDNFQETINIGFDIETGGHVFQVYVTNGLGIQENYFIPQTTGEWGKGDIHLAFNLYRTFVIKKPKIHKIED